MPTDIASTTNLVPEHSIFICYRRDDAHYSGDLLEMKLQEQFGNAAVFRDIHRIRGGADVGAAIQAALKVCRVGLVLVGTEWLTLKTGDGTRRIDDQQDFVRLEVAELLSNPKCRVIPVYLNAAAPLSANQLPRPLAKLARLNGLPMRWGDDITADLARIFNDIRDALEAWTDPSPTTASRMESPLDTARAAGASKSPTRKKPATARNTHSAKIVVFVHGWSVTNTETYGGLPAALVKNGRSQLDLEISHLYLGKYVSFADEVGIDDIARAMQAAVTAEVLPRLSKGERFACITHSTGGPMVRKWLDVYHRGKLDQSPLGHLIMLAPTNHGSALAQLGKSRLAATKFFVGGAVPGFGMMDWMELGSDQSRALNLEWLNYDCVAGGLYPFVLTGQTIDRAFYDPLYTYTGEPGSDGVVRVAAANMNYGLIRLVQDGSNLRLSKEFRSAKTALGVLPGCSHSGSRIGILGSVNPNDVSHPTVQWVLRCLEVDSAASYNRLVKDLEDLTVNTQKEEHEERVRALFVHERTFIKNRYSMLVIRLADDRGNDLSDYDVLFTASPYYDPNQLPPGFFVDCQRNLLNPGKRTYYIDYDVLHNWLNWPEMGEHFGIHVAARPSAGFAYYTVAEYRGSLTALKGYLEPNQTLMVDIMLRRHVVEGVFRLTQNLSPEDFKQQPKGEELP